jgi:hypothetical protein
MFNNAFEKLIKCLKKTIAKLSSKMPSKRFRKCPQNALKMPLNAHKMPLKCPQNAHKNTQLYFL